MAEKYYHAHSIAVGTAIDLSSCYTTSRTACGSCDGTRCEPRKITGIHEYLERAELMNRTRISCFLMQSPKLAINIQAGILSERHHGDKNSRFNVPMSDP